MAVVRRNRTEALLVVVTMPYLFILPGDAFRFGITTTRPNGQPNYSRRRRKKSRRADMQTVEIQSTLGITLPTEP